MPNLTLAIAAMAVTGVVSIWFISLANAVTQLRAVPAMKGRVMGLWATALPGSLLVSGPAVGWVAQAWGGRVALAAGGVAVLGTVALGWRALSADAGDPAGGGTHAPPLAPEPLAGEPVPSEAP
jgi:hypothetical protein